MSGIQSGGAFARQLLTPPRTVTGAATITANDDWIIVTGSGIQTLPLASAYGEGRHLYVSNRAGAIITLARSGSDVIIDRTNPSGIASISISNGETTEYLCDGISRWYESAA